MLCFAEKNISGAAIQLYCLSLSADKLTIHASFFAYSGEVLMTYPHYA